MCVLCSTRIVRREGRRSRERERNNCKECSPSSSLLFLWLWFLLWLSVSSSSSFFPNFVCRLASLLPACLSLSTSIISWFSIQDKKTAILLSCSCLLRADNLLFPSNSIFGLNHWLNHSDITRIIVLFILWYLRLWFSWHEMMILTLVWTSSSV